MMGVLKKQFVVVYTKDKVIVSKSKNNIETFYPEIHEGAEFDNEYELNEFIMSKQLTDEKFTIGD